MRKARTPTTVRRSFLLCVFLLLALAGVAGKLVWLQAIEAPAFAQQAESQRLKEWEIPAQRGAIFDREGTPLAIGVEGREVYAVPREVADPEATARALADVLGGDPEDYLGRLTLDTTFVYLARKVDMERAEALADLDLDGIHFRRDSIRAYPNGTLAAQAIGFVGIDGYGLEGLEQHYESVLAGTPGQIRAERDSGLRAIPGGMIEETSPVDGSSLILTLDAEIQYEAQRLLRGAIEKTDAKSGTVTVLDPDDGSVLALAAYPEFDPNRFSEEEPSAFRNRAITDVYEPGSTMKPFIAAAAIEAGLFGPDDVFDLPPTVEVGGYTIRESHPRERVRWTLEEIIAHSSNVGVVTVGQALGPDAIYEALRRYGFAQTTDIDLPGEVPGYLPEPDRWSASTIGNIPFGQGISITPIQLARSMAVIANGGRLVTPHLVESIPDRPDIDLSWPTRQVMEPDTAAVMRRVLRTAVEEGTGGKARVPGYPTAGKTGTAQKPRSDGRGYAKGAYVASFAGFLPADDPAVVIVVTVDEPVNGHYGGTVAAPVFRELGRFCMSHLAVPPPSSGGGEGE